MTYFFSRRPAIPAEFESAFRLQAHRILRDKVRWGEKARRAYGAVIMDLRLATGDTPPIAECWGNLAVERVNEHLASLRAVGGII